MSEPFPCMQMIISWHFILSNSVPTTVFHALDDGETLVLASVRPLQRNMRLDLCLGRLALLDALAAALLRFLAVF